MRHNKIKMNYDILKKAYDYVFEDLNIDKFHVSTDLQEQIEEWYVILHKKKYVGKQHYFSHERRISVKRDWALERGWAWENKRLHIFLNEKVYVKHTSGYVWVGL